MIPQTSKNNIATCVYKKQRCGGCQLNAIPYAKQLEKKADQVAQLYRGIATVDPIIGAQNPENYRCKVVSTFTTSKTKRLISGIYAVGSHKVVDVKSCYLHDQLADKIIAGVIQAANDCHLPAYDEDRHRGLLRHVLVRIGKYTGQAMVVIVTAAPIFPGSNQFVKKLRALCPQVNTVVQNVNPTETSAVLGTMEKVLFGKGYIEDTLCGLKFRISASSFYQINPPQTQLLYDTALKMAAISKTTRVLDAYCGTGTIGLAASKYAKEVVGVEVRKSAVRDAVYNAKTNKIDNIRFVCADAESFVNRLTLEGESFGCAIMDPPRDGSTESFLKALAKMAPKKIVYISCSPQTQVRDVKILMDLGYQLRKVQPVDLFPHTNHTECIALLERGNKQMGGKDERAFRKSTVRK